MRYFSICMVLLSLYMLGQSTLHENTPATSERVVSEVPIWTLPEMDEIQQTRNWAPDRTPLTAEESEAFLQCWEPLYPKVAEKVTTSLIWELSRFGKDRMEYYARPSEIYRAEYLTWNPVARNEDQKQILMSTVLERLPAPYPIRRELCAFCLFNPETRNLDWVLITIRLRER